MRRFEFGFSGYCGLSALKTFVNLVDGLGHSASPV